MSHAQLVVFPAPVASTPEAINFSWLLKLRWGAIAGQVATITAVQRLYGVRLPMYAIGVVGRAGRSARRRHRRSRHGDGRARARARR